MKLTCGKLMQQVDKTGSFSWWADRVSAISPPPSTLKTPDVSSRAHSTRARSIEDFQVLPTNQTFWQAGSGWKVNSAAGPLLLTTAPTGSYTSCSFASSGGRSQWLPEPEQRLFFSFSPDTLAVRYECNQLLFFVFFFLFSFLIWSPKLMIPSIVNPDGQKCEHTVKHLIFFLLIEKKMHKSLCDYLTF